MSKHMRHAGLDAWLSRLESLHWREIDLGLDRVRTVLDAVRLDTLPFIVITVGGTNGKGSCLAYLDSILRCCGARTGLYTSPHLLRYNERIRVDGREADDALLLDSFAVIDTGRGDTTLTYFEFGTLAALDVFRRTGVDVALLEVGMGGRLDAVNVVDPDAAIVTSVGLDHTGYLGIDREQIAAEKAGIFRAGRAAICGDRDPPLALSKTATDIGADWRVIGTDFEIRQHDGVWDWYGCEQSWCDLPAPPVPGAVQYDNAASALAALEALQDRFDLSLSAVRSGIARTSLPARFQCHEGPVVWIYDVAHNADAAAVLAANLDAGTHEGRTMGVFGVLDDKDADSIIDCVGSRIDCWFVAAPDSSRALPAEALAEKVSRITGRSVRVCADVAAACRGAHENACDGDRVVVFGSFYTVGEAMAVDAHETAEVAGIGSRS